jgi:hypothetical protein
VDGCMGLFDEGQSEDASEAMMKLQYSYFFGTELTRFHRLCV